MSYQVALLNFEGPLDLLLQLVERAQLAASELALADLTNQYLSYCAALEQLDPLEASRFTSLASRLLYLKSRALLPSSPELEAEMVALTQQLVRYGQHRQAAQWLGRALSGGPQGFGRARASQPVETAAPPNLTPAALHQAMAQALTRVQGAPPHAVAAAPVSVATMVTRLRHYPEALKAGEGVTLQAFFGQLVNRSEIVAAFLAALELWRSGTLQLTQAGGFSIIQLAYA